MDIDIITRKDLLEFRKLLMEDFRTILQSLEIKPHDSPSQYGYKTRKVKQMLNCSTNTLNSLRIKRFLRTKKVGGNLYYHPEDIRKLLEEGFH